MCRRPRQRIVCRTDGHPRDPPRAAPGRSCTDRARAPRGRRPAALLRLDRPRERRREPDHRRPRQERRMNFRCLPVLLVLGALGRPAAAAAAPTWLTPVPVFGTGLGGVATAMAPDGTSMVVRARDTGAGQVLEAITRP